MFNLIALGMPGGFEWIIITLIFGFLAFPIISLLPTIFYLLTLHKALNKCKSENRTLSPGLVWLYLIPFFNLIWHFVIVINIASSLDNEFKSRQIVTEPLPGKSLGLALCILAVCTLIPVIGLISLIAAFICWICYWIKIANFSKLLTEHSA